MSLILKVQRPIRGDNMGEWLFYDRHKRVYFMMPVEQIPVDLVATMGEKFKIYVEGDYNAKTGTFTYHKLLPDQPW